MSRFTDDRLAHFQDQIKNWRPLHPFYLYAPLLCTAVGGTCSILRYYNGWSYEEAGIWINLGFWGGYIAGAVVAALVAVWVRRNGQKLKDLMKECEGERAKRNL